MQILMLSWEYPPRCVGGLAQHVYDLSVALAQSGEEIHLITCSAPGAPQKEIVKGVHVYRVNPYDLPSLDFLTWVLQLNFSIMEYAVSLMNSFRCFDMIHAHDWLVAYAGRALKHAYKIPLIATIHATEYGRNQGLHNDLQRYISNVEWWLTYEAWRVIVCSNYMKKELQTIFQLPGDKIYVVPNGVDLSRYRKTTNKGLSRNIFAASDEKIVFFIGRLVQEKGVHILLEAVPKVIHDYPKVKFVIAGRGPAEEYLKNKAKGLGIYDRVYFTGYIDDETRDFLYQEASVAVFPSLYEPFGIVVLEAMAARTPVVVADVGGLSEIITHEVNGLKCCPGDPNSLSDNILRLLRDSAFAAQLAERAEQNLNKFYTWDEISQQTQQVYAEVKKECESSVWRTDIDMNLFDADKIKCIDFEPAGLDRYFISEYKPGEENKEQEKYRKIYSTGRRH